MVERAARAAGFDMKIHPHMLRHKPSMSALCQKRTHALQQIGVALPGLGSR
jgi:site-specific recombinase XerD